MTDTAVPAVDELTSLRDALVLALPWLRACVAGYGAAAEAIGGELMLSHGSYDHALLLHGLSATVVSLLGNVPDPAGYLDGLLAPT